MNNLFRGFDAQEGLKSESLKGLSWTDPGHTILIQQILAECSQEIKTSDAYPPFLVEILSINFGLCSKRKRVP